MPPKPRIVRKNAPTSTNPVAKPGPSTVAATGTANAGAIPASSSKPATPSVGAMLPPPVPTVPKAILEPELDALSRTLRNITVKTGEVYAFYKDTYDLKIRDFAPKPPQSLTTALSRELEKYDQLCDAMESQLLRAVAVLQRDLEREDARVKAEADALAAAEAAKVAAVAAAQEQRQQENQQEGAEDVEMAPVSSAGEAASSSSSSNQLAISSSPSIAGPSARRQSTISFSSLNRPQFVQKLDLSAAGLAFNPEELTGRPASPITLAPKSARLTSAGDFPPEFMAAVLAEQANRPVDIDLTLDDVSNMGESVIGSSADKPIELDLDMDMDIDMDMSSMPPMDLFGDGASQNGSSGEPKVEDLDIDLLGNLSAAPPADSGAEEILASLNSASNSLSAPGAVPEGEQPQFDIGQIDFSSLPLDFGSGDGADMNLGDMEAFSFLNMDAGNTEGGQELTSSDANAPNTSNGT